MLNFERKPRTGRHRRTDRPNATPPSVAPRSPASTARRLGRRFPLRRRGRLSFLAAAARPACWTCAAATRFNRFGVEARQRRRASGRLQYLLDRVVPPHERRDDSTWIPAAPALGRFAGAPTRFRPACNSTCFASSSSLLIRPSRSLAASRHSPFLADRKRELPVFHDLHQSSVRHPELTRWRGRGSGPCHELHRFSDHRLCHLLAAQLAMIASRAAAHADAGADRIDVPRVITGDFARRPPRGRRPIMTFPS